ncbi:flagellar export chaperone FliS [Paractinoplanes durhamensis]|uniref:Flagellar protein FliS n=1 Tax=Paractinoplanes durhamensis TaxID=113563 RepID=A0ABQ3YQ49_9ACTN|nr:flagellar export chaperone FliS [Actinoplanes durhamensis]GID99664.1 flagellar protein FliS [Actinoplanes durhamensis]
MTAPHLRDRYLQDSVNTASPGKLLIMLYDRLVLDLGQAEQALAAQEREVAHEKITHAQEIVIELRTSLDVDAWSGAPALANIYGWMLTELIGANIARDAARVKAIRELAEPLRDTWREAAAAAVAG